MCKNITMAVVAGCLALAVAARAQMLDFGSGAPEPGTGANALALAASLIDDAQRIETEHTGEITSADAARIALRRLAAAMLTQGENAGAKGSARIVAARRIAYRLDRIDIRLGQLQASDPAAPEMVLAQATLAGANIPEDPAQLDRMMRNVFAPSSPSGRPPAQIGWISNPAPNPAPSPPPNQRSLDTEITNWERDSILDPDTIAALRALEARLTLLEQWSVYHASIASLRLQIREAATCLNLDPKWIGQEAADALIARFERALLEAADPVRTDTARTQLRKVTLLTAITPAVQSLTSGTWARPARESLSQTIKGRGWAPGDELKSIELLARAIRQLQQGERYDNDSAVIRQLRPAWRVIIRKRRDAEESLTHAFSAMLASPGAETDPAVLAALGAHARTIEDFALLIRASDAMSQSPSVPTNITPNRPVLPQPIPTPTPSRQPVASPTWQRAANVFLELGQQMAKPSTADEAQTQLRELATRVATLARFPGEASLDLRQPGWAELIDGPPNALSAAIDAARIQWVSAISQEGPDADASRLFAMHDLMQLLDAARLARQYRSPTSHPRMNAWPGWSLSPRAIAGMLTQINSRLPNLVDLATSGNPAEAQVAIDEVTEQANALLLFSALEQRAGQAGLGPEPTTPEAAIWSLSAGPPDYGDVYLVSLRADLAHVSRYAEEAFAPPTGNDADRTRNTNAARSYCSEIAAQVLEILTTR